MPKIETFKILEPHPDHPDGLWVEVPGVGFEHRGEGFFYRADSHRTMAISHAASGLFVCEIQGRRSIKAGKKALEDIAESHGWEFMVSIWAGSTT